MFLVLYVGDILLIGNDIPTLAKVKQWLGKCFTMKDLGEAETSKASKKRDKTRPRSFVYDPVGSFNVGDEFNTY